ncbi:nicotinate-nucleotide adenylyltransferase [Williamsia sp. CHRR-6]|uniref:nicotinate-nucleotide adenylyltransferase n=1 Tax=Williamsia sp. CHRR-6 TaxID=2835871 RepID=UPI001BDAF3E0|nr:nicotinate-nucleotide adenylyltransferase [Williamsia sp. CHRR-6]MBT0565416.1 nicotinate-nucleotide adenylyltransferase [Williamsia sp. CHRR-6]
MPSEEPTQPAQVSNGASAQTPRRRRIGVMGGTFDPIHNGHLVAANEVAHRFELDEVVFVPTGRPWQKLAADDPATASVSPAEDRYLMTVIATAANPRFSVSRVDIERDGDTYTVDTLRDLHRLHPDADQYFITGADALSSILSWHSWEELFELARFVGVSRPGYELGTAHLGSHLKNLPSDALHLIEVPALAISSTDCRRRAADGRPVWYLVPDGVVQYISKRRLYRSSGSQTRGVSGPSTDPVSAAHPQDPEHVVGEPSRRPAALGTESPLPKGLS